MALMLLACACGGRSTPTPTPTPVPPTPPANALPVIDAITVQGSRANEPAGFADVAETVRVSAKVHDDETSVDRLQYDWTAPLGVFSGSGASVTWTAPSSVASASHVTLTLTVTEKYGASLEFQHSTTATATLLLHDSSHEVGDMARQFLLDFSDSSMRDVPYIMRNFSKTRCPDPSEIDSEFTDVTRNRDERRITASSVGNAATTVDFGGICPFGFKHGDACAIVPVFWADVDLKTGATSTTRGDDVVAAAYSSADERWWLCASNYQALSTFGRPFRFSR